VLTASPSPGDFIFVLYPDRAEGVSGTSDPALRKTPDTEEEECEKVEERAGGHCGQEDTV
jgi:hypothetical protein